MCKGDYFVAEGIPLTEFSDSNPTVPISVPAGRADRERYRHRCSLETLTVVAPVSTEMHCDTCHASGQETRVETSPGLS